MSNEAKPRKYVAVGVSVYSELIGTGTDAGYEDVKLGNIPSIIVGKRKINIPVVAIEQKYGLAPCELDPVIDNIIERKKLERTSRDA